VDPRVSAVLPRRRWQGESGALSLSRPAAGLVVLALSGRDSGEFGDEPFEELAKDLESGPIELFIDARGAKAAGVEVSGAWAIWLGKQRARLSRVHFLTGTRFITLSAELVRSFSGLGELMRLYTNPADFDVVLAETAAARRKD
jgi:hypothetical protein